MFSHTVENNGDLFMVDSDFTMCIVKNCRRAEDLTSEMVWGGIVHAYETHTPDSVVKNVFFALKKSGWMKELNLSQLRQLLDSEDLFKYKDDIEKYLILV
jgi:hypothetical protein